MLPPDRFRSPSYNRRHFVIGTNLSASILLKVSSLFLAILTAATTAVLVRSLLFAGFQPGDLPLRA